MPHLKLILLCILAVTVGCDKSKPVRTDNPVVGPPPPRVTPDDLRIDKQNYASIDGSSTAQAKYVQTKGTASLDASETALNDAQIVATVNGFPILAGDVLERYGMQLQQAKAQVTPAQYEQARAQLIKRDLDSHIERALLVQTLKSEIDGEQMAGVTAQLDGLFEEEVMKMMERTNSVTSHDLNQKLKAQGTSLEQLRSAFGNQQLAMQYLALQSQEQKILSRNELLKYYQDHIDEYTKPARVKWQEIIVYFKPHGGKAGAAKIVKQAIKDLQAGEDFADVARKHSDGATASQGGVWDWVQKESIADEVLRTKLFSINEGGITDVIVKKNGFQIAKVIDREDQHATPFHEHYEGIRSKLTKEARTAATKKVLADLKETATIEVLIDENSTPGL